MATTRIGKILDEHGSIAFPGVFDTLSAKIAERVGFPMGFISGYSVAATSIGEPDMGYHPLFSVKAPDRVWRSLLG